MAVKISTDSIAINFSKLTKDSDNTPVLSAEKIELLEQTLAELIEEIISDNTIIIEIVTK